MVVDQVVTVEPLLSRLVESLASHTVVPMATTVQMATVVHWIWIHPSELKMGGNDGVRIAARVLEMHLSVLGFDLSVLGFDLSVLGFDLWTLARACTKKRIAVGPIAISKGEEFLWRVIAVHILV